MPQSVPQSESPNSLDDDDFAIRVFTLADHAAVTPDGKLYISGGAVERIFLPQLPGPLGQLWLAVRIHLPWRYTSNRLRVELRALDADRNPVGQDPIAIADVEVGRAPGQRPGDEIAVQFALPLTGFPIPTPGESKVYFHLVVEGEVLGILPLQVSPAPRLAPSK